MLEPRITIYGKVLDNKDQSLLRGYHEWKSAITWNYGQINGIVGGESPYIIELDIWNNEPAFNGLSGLESVADATNCSLTVWDNSSSNSTINMSHNSIPFMNARCVTNDFNSTFIPIAGPNALTNIIGNVNSSIIGTIQGPIGGDHAVVQTKIILPNTRANSEVPLVTGDRNFIFAFNYEFV